MDSEYCTVTYLNYLSPKQLKKLNELVDWLTFLCSCKIKSLKTLQKAEISKFILNSSLNALLPSFATAKGLKAMLIHNNNRTDNMTSRGRSKTPAYVNDHRHPRNELTEEILKTKSRKEILTLLLRKGGITFITKDEDNMLNAAGLRKMSKGKDRYKAAGIQHTNLHRLCVSQNNGRTFRLLK